MNEIETKSLSDYYTTGLKLGEGSFAAVFKAINIKTKEKCAVKQIYVQPALVDQAIGEVNRLKQFHNDHIIIYKESFYDQDEFYLNVVMELCQDSLRGQFQDKKLYQKKQLKSFLVQMVSAFLQLEKKEVMHLDLKPQNILIANQQGNYYKICDFGCSQISKVSKLSGYQNPCFGTYNYLAPQLHTNYEGKKSRSSADIWSLGITLYQMFFWRLPFSTNDGIMDRAQVQSYFNNKRSINFETSVDAPQQIINIMKQMLKPIPTERITWDKLKKQMIKHMRVEQFQFMNIKDFINNFFDVFQLFITIIKILKSNMISNSSKFWKDNNKFLCEFKDILIHFSYIIMLKLQQKVGYKLKYHLTPAQKQKLSKLKKQIQEYQIQASQALGDKKMQISDSDYQQVLLIDQLAACSNKIKAYAGVADKTIQFLNIFCKQLHTALDKSLQLISDTNIFIKSMQLKNGV